MASPNFSSLLNKPIGEIKRPVVLPEGTYFGVISNYELVESGKKKTPGVQFLGRLSHAADDVELVDDEGNPIEVAEKPFPRRGTTFWISENSLFMLADFLKGLNIDLEGSTLTQALPQTIGQSVKLDIARVTVESDTGDVRYANDVRSMSAA